MQIPVVNSRKEDRTTHRQIILSGNFSEGIALYLWWQAVWDTNFTIANTWGMFLRKNMILNIVTQLKIVNGLQLKILNKFRNSKDNFKPCYLSLEIDGWVVVRQKKPNLFWVCLFV